MIDPIREANIGQPGIEADEHGDPSQTQGAYHERLLRLPLVWQRRPPKTRVEDRRFCSTTCRHRWHVTCRRLGELILNGWPNSVRGFAEAEVEPARGILPPRLRACP